MWGSVMCEVDSLRDNDNRKRSIKDGIIRLFQNPLFLAFFLNFAALLFRLLFFDMKYEVSDDFMTDAVLSGAFGSGYDPQLLFGNKLLGYILVGLYKLIPQISFYFVLLVTLGFVSVTVILYLLFKRTKNGIAIGIALLFLFFFADDIYILVQFTKVSAAAGIAGGLLVLHGLWDEKNHRNRFIALGSILTILGVMVRFDAVYIFGAFLVLAFVNRTVLFLEKQGEKFSITKVTKEEWKTVAGRFLVCVFLIGILFGLQFISAWLSNRDEGHRAFNDFQQYRIGITDVRAPEYETVQSEYETLGLDELDRYMLVSWSFVDRDVYSDQLLGEVGAIHKDWSNKTSRSFSHVIDTLVERNTLTYWSALGVYLLVLICVFLGKRKVHPILSLLVAFFLLATLIFTGRTMYRVEWSVYFCAASSILFGFVFDNKSKIALQKRSFFGKEREILPAYILILVLVLMITRIPRLLRDSEYKSMSDEQYIESFNGIMLSSGEFHPEKYVFPTVDRKPFAKLTDRMENDPDHFYYIDFYSGIQSLYFDYDPWIRPRKGLFCDSYAFIGSVAMHHPGERDALIKNGVDPDSPYKSVLNENIYLVETYYAKEKLEYIKKYYFPDAKMKLIDTVGGYQIWKVYIPEESEENDQL